MRCHMAAGLSLSYLRVWRTPGTHSRLLLHAAVMRCSKESLYEVAALIVDQNRATLVYR